MPLRPIIWQPLQQRGLDEAVDAFSKDGAESERTSAKVAQWNGTTER